MSASLRSLASATLVVVLLTCAIIASRHSADVPVRAEATADRPASSDAASQTLAADDTHRWYKGNIHTHSLWSDGDDYPEMIALWYRDHGYNFLCYTDHNVLATRERWTNVARNKGGREAYRKLKQQFPDWVEERNSGDNLEVRLRQFPELSARFNEPGEFLLIQGEEITDRFQNLPVHMNATNIQQLLPPLHGSSVYETMQNTVNAVIAQRERTGEPILVHLNHPNFGWGITAEDLMRVRGENFFEVYNGHPGVRNSGDDDHASTERMWDIMLTRRIAELDMPLMYGLATDDGHSYHNIPSRASEPGRGWVMVLADELTPRALIAALEAGRFYASSGVTLERITAADDRLEVVVQQEANVEYTIDFIGTRRGYEPEGQPVLGRNGNPLHATLQYDDALGTVLHSVTGAQARYEFQGDELYVRARVTSTRRHPNPSEIGEFERCWVQPVRGPGAPEPR